MVADLTAEGGVSLLISTTIRRYQKIDVLVNCAGIFLGALLKDSNYSITYSQVTAIDEVAVLQVTQMAIPYLNKTNGSIINIASDVADKPVSLE